MRITRCYTKQEMEESDEYMNRKSRKNGREGGGEGERGQVGLVYSSSLSNILEKGVTMGEAEDG